MENIRKDLRKGMTIIILIKESLKATSVKSVQKNQVNLTFLLQQLEWSPLQLLVMIESLFEKAVNSQKCGATEYADSC